MPVFHGSMIVRRWVQDTQASVSARVITYNQRCSLSQAKRYECDFGMSGHSDAICEEFVFSDGCT